MHQKMEQCQDIRHVPKVIQWEYRESLFRPSQFFSLFLVGGLVGFHPISTKWKFLGETDASFDNFITLFLRGHKKNSKVSN